MNNNLPLPGQGQWVAYTRSGRAYHKITLHPEGFPDFPLETKCGLYRSGYKLWAFRLRDSAHFLTPCKVCWRKELANATR